jgi:hypothetical protein
MINFVINFDGNLCKIRKLEPPPLIFYENKESERNVGTKRNQILMSSEPPPLVPIRR